MQLTVGVEWLHRSAYSFGGGGKPDSAQVPENLVFGTFETNTEMIRSAASVSSRLCMPKH